MCVCLLLQTVPLCAEHLCETMRSVLIPITARYCTDGVSSLSLYLFISSSLHPCPLRQDGRRDDFVCLFPSTVHQNMLPHGQNTNCRGGSWTISCLKFRTVWSISYVIETLLDLGFLQRCSLTSLFIFLFL